MSIREFFSKYSFWAVFAASCAGCILLLLVLAIVFLVFVPPVKTPDWFFFLYEWPLPILFGLFLVSAKLHGEQLNKGIEEAYQNTQNKKELESINKRMELLEKEKQLNKERLRIHEEMVEIRKLERDRINQ